jgi:hypothetical protein
MVSPRITSESAGMREACSMSSTPRFKPYVRFFEISD